MTDIWDAHILDKSGNILGRFSFQDNPTELYNYCPSAALQGFTHYLDITPGLYVMAGNAVEADVFKNGQLYAIISYTLPEPIVSAQIENRPILLHNDHIKNVAIIKVGPSVSQQLITVPRIVQDDCVCTCGVKFTGGMCSDWCDLVRSKVI